MMKIWKQLLEEWTLPVNFAFGKTVIIKGRPWKFSLELNY
jgi:hypothetical protein